MYFNLEIETNAAESCSVIYC